MCGLVGLFDSRGRRPVDQALLSRMNDLHAHRGPDGAGLHVEDGLGLGHRRLAIIDVGLGRQPLYNEDGAVVVVFNGEIYNFAELVAELQSLGHRFRTHSDTEVIVHAWEQWGRACLERFRGMFAFALWDADAETLFLARDRLGKKPLHYACLPDGMMVFGSELKSVMAHPDVPRELDPRAIEDFLAYGYVPHPRSVFSAVRKLPPAHCLTWRRGGEMRIERYWDVPVGRPDIFHMEEAAAALAEQLREATRLRLVSDVPLGAFLSGGVDSSAVVALMAGLSGSPVKTFCIGFGDKSHDESALAQRLAQRYHTDHLSRQVDPEDFDLLPRLAGQYDEPFGDSSAMPTWRVAALARERVTVALSGDGGDEVFAGYRRYALHAAVDRVRQRLPGMVRGPLFGTLGRLYPKLDWAPRPLRAKTTLTELSMDSATGYFAAVSIMDDATRRAIASPGFRRQLQGYHASEVVRGHMAAAETDDPLQKVQYADIKTWLSDGVLVKVDRASMANSLEVRSPLLDHRLVEWSFRLAPELKLKNGSGKRVLKRAMEPLVDHDLLYRPKQGFTMPLCRWFRGPLAELVRGLPRRSAFAQSGLFDLGAIARLVEQHLSGSRDHSAALWLLLMLDAFLEREAGLGQADRVA
ncbi:MAG TPA: XrtA/PEP-CTERM system amidotransferase [Magnetospirillum sp.]|jgi:asparagine synthase (glutamine-hydrolysing)|nr:XrtA/PEP-CTERM system amidotransferase [Magnetospirillum sp.]